MKDTVLKKQSLKVMRTGLGVGPGARHTTTLGNEGAGVSAAICLERRFHVCLHQNLGQGCGALIFI